MRKNLLCLSLRIQALGLVIQSESKAWENGDPGWVRRGKDGRFSGGGSSSQNAESSKIVAVFDKAVAQAGKLLSDIQKELNLVSKEIKERIRKAIVSPELKKARKEIGETLQESVPEAFEVYEEVVAQIESYIEEDPNIELKKIASIAKESSSKAGEKMTERGKPNMAAVLAFGGLVAASVFFGPAALLATGGAALAYKTFSIPNWQQRGGKLRQEAFLMKEENRKNVVGYIGEYLSGGASNLAFNVGLLATAVGLSVVAVEVLTGKAEENRQDFVDSIEGFSRGVQDSIVQIKWDKD